VKPVEIISSCGKKKEKSKPNYFKQRLEDLAKKTKMGVR